MVKVSDDKMNNEHCFFPFENSHVLQKIILNIVLVRKIIQQIILKS